MYREELESEELAGQPLSMWQYKRMFNSCVVPGEDCDQMVEYPDDELKHIIVMRNDLMYRVEVIDEHGEIYPSPSTYIYI